VPCWTDSIVFVPRVVQHGTRDWTSRGLPAAPVVAAQAGRKYAHKATVRGTRSGETRELARPGGLTIAAPLFSGWRESDVRKWRQVGR
jgi:hypothetical protein